jgi:cell division protein FtsB
MKLLAALLAGLLVLIQYPLWLGKGGWLRVWELDRQLLSRQNNNQRLKERNLALDAEVKDLRQGLFAVEERARYELGMVRPDEVFIQVNEGQAQRLGPAEPAPPAHTLAAGGESSTGIKTAAVPRELPAAPR